MTGVRNAFASRTQAEGVCEDDLGRIRADVITVVRLRLADVQSENLSPTEEAALVERYATDAVLARAVPAAVREALVRQATLDVKSALRGGAGPLDAALEDRDVFDVMVNAPDRIFVRRAGVGTVPLRESFASNDEVNEFVARFAAPVRRQFSEAEPLLNLQMPSGTRLNAVRYPVARDGTALTLRIHSRFPEYRDLLGTGICPDGSEDWTPRLFRRRPRYPGPDAPADAFFRWMVAARASFVILGGTGDGKTTLFNALLGLCPRDERLVVIEDTREVRLPQPNAVHLETREFVPEGAKVITQYDLVENALRMFPTRLLLGEVRRGEVLLAWLRAARSGHPGSGFTFHATTMDDFLESATQELQLAMPSLDAETAARRLGGAIHVAIRYGKHAEVDGHFVQEIAALSLDEQRRVQVTTLYRLAERTAGHLVLESTGAPPPWLSPEGYLLF